MNLLSIAGFTNLGYRLQARDWAEVTTDMSGKTVVITGATGGLGLVSARALASLNARVVLVGRSPEKLTAALDSIGGESVAYRADLSLMDEVRDLAARIRADESRVDVLVNNVGVLLPDREVTSEHLEKTFATNLAGQFLLTNLLSARLIESAPARVINVTSGGMYSERIRPDDLQFEQDTYAGAKAYARTKRGQVILTEMWARRLEGSGVVVNAMHPGWAKTPGVADSLPVFNRVMRPLLRSPEQGADTIVWLAASEEAGSMTGQLWFDRRRVATHLTERTRESSRERNQLWENLVEVTRSDMEYMSV